MDSRNSKEPPFAIDRSQRGGLAGQVAASLRRSIEAGYYRPGDVIPPVRSLAKMLGVSKGTAERAVADIRDEGLISPRPRIGSVVRASGCPRWKGHVLAVVPPGTGNPFDNPVHAVLRDALVGAGYLATAVTVLRNSKGGFSDFALLETTMRQQVDLVVLLHDKDVIAKWLSKRGVPFVRLTSSPAPQPPNCVGVVRRRNDVALGDLAAHCRSAGVGSVLQVCAWHGLDLSEPLGPMGVKVSTCRPRRGSSAPPTGFELSRWAMDLFSRRLGTKGRQWLPDLLFFDDDHLATGALTALAAAGVRIPGDVRVATWANCETGPVWFRPLSRIEMDSAAAGTTFARCILEYLAGGTFPQGVAVGPRFIPGETM